MQTAAGETGFTEGERATLAAVCDALRPDGDAGLDVPAAMESAFLLLPPEQLAEVRLLLKVLDTRVAGLVFAGTPRGIVSLSQPARERMLQRLSTSALPPMRSGFQALKRLSSFLAYSLTDSAGRNPEWAAIGYAPSPLPPARAPALRVTTITKPTALDCDVCIVGSGAGGGVVAAAIAERGRHVIVLEAGPPDQAADFQQRELEGLQRLYLDSGLTSSRDAAVAVLAGACVGGGTAVNWQTSLRPPDAVRAEWAEQSGCDHFAGETFSRALDHVASRIGVSTDESVVNENNAALERGCAALRYSATRIARNSRGCDPSQCGYCTFGCRVGGKQSTTVTFLHDAQSSRNTEVVAGCRAERVTYANGQVTGVHAAARDASGSAHQVTVRASTVVVAAGGIESPALLIRSGVELPALGRNLFLHPTSSVAGRYRGRIDPWAGPPQTILCDEFGTVDDGYGFRLETAPTHPGLLALALPWTNARSHRAYMRQCAHVSAVIVLTRDSEGGRVRVRRSGRAVIDYTPGPRERALLKRGIAAAARVHFAAGADEVLTLHTRGFTLARNARTTDADIARFVDRIAAERVHANWSTLFSAHQMGTCRMGRDPRSAVCDARGEVFGVNGLYVADASAFPLSSGVNPMITVMALAQCVAEGL